MVIAICYQFRLFTRRRIKDLPTVKAIGSPRTHLAS